VLSWLCRQAIGTGIYGVESHLPTTQTLQIL
jgi:hypothetical protein